MQGQDKPECQGTLIPLDATFNKAVEISSIAWAGDSVYMVAEKCGLAFIGKITGQKFAYRTQPITKRNYEGMAYWNKHFYLSDDSQSAIYVYNMSFQQRGYYPIVLRKDDEGIKDSKGAFEGIAVLNATTFYILLEKVSGKNVAVLYKATLNKNGQLNIQYKKYLPLDKNSRYCDLYYNKKDTILYLLRSSYDSLNRCDSFINKYDIMKLKTY